MLGLMFEDRSDGHKQVARNVAKMLAAAVVGWTLIAGFMTLARAEDAAAQGRDSDFWPAFALMFPYFLPLMALSWTLQLGFDRWPSLTQEPRKTLLLFAGVLFFFYPAYLFYEAIVGLTQSGEELERLLPTLKAQSRFGWWIDGMIVVGAVVLHYAIASRARLVDRDIALQRQISDNLQLRLTLLQSQLEPHFLFNVLNSISALVRSGDRSLALDVLEKVSELLRYALRASRAGTLTMQDELDFADRYLAMQSMRHGDRLQIKCQVEDVNWSEIDCPPLLLQPLIENAMRHGIESAPGPNRVTMSVGCKDDDVFIEIVNDIDGIMPSLSGNGIGLSLVRDRLQAVYGMRASLRAEQNSRKFTAMVRFPADGTDG